MNAMIVLVSEKGINFINMIHRDLFVKIGNILTGNTLYLKHSCRKSTYVQYAIDINNLAFNSQENCNAFRIELEEMELYNLNILGLDINAHLYLFAYIEFLLAICKATFLYKTVSCEAQSKIKALWCQQTDNYRVIRNGPSKVNIILGYTCMYACN